VLGRIINSNRKSIGEILSPKAKGEVVNSQTDGNGDNEKGNKDDNYYYD
jgi:hypothetical protein